MPISVYMMELGLWCLTSGDAWKRRYVDLTYTSRPYLLQRRPENISSSDQRWVPELGKTCFKPRHPIAPKRQPQPSRLFTAEMGEIMSALIYLGPLLFIYFLLPPCFHLANS